MTNETQKVCAHCGGITYGDEVEDEFHDSDCPHRCDAAVAAERERCAKRCDGLAIATNITGGGEWNEAQRAAATTAAEWLAREIRRGEE